MLPKTHCSRAHYCKKRRFRPRRPSRRAARTRMTRLRLAPRFAYRLGRESLRDLAA